MKSPPTPAHNPLILRIGHLDYVVHTMSAQEMEEHEDWIGCHEPDLNSIAVRAVAPDGRHYGPGEINSTVVHELVHAFHHAYRIPSEGLDEEGICRRLEGPLCAFIRDNQGFLNRLSEALQRGQQVSLEGTVTAG